MIPPELFYECQTCGHRFILSTKRLAYCPFCEKKTAGFKKIPVEKVAICNHCAEIMWTDGHKANHICSESEEDIYWIDEVMNEEKI